MNSRYLSYVIILLLVLCLSGITIFLANGTGNFVNKIDDQTSNASSYLSVTCGGQLGNQLFQTSTGLVYAWDHNLKPVFPGLNRNSDNLSYNKDNFFFRLDSSEAPFPLKKYSTSHPNYEALPDNLKNVILEGGFFSWKYFHHHRDKILEIYAPAQKVVDKLNSKYEKLISLDNTVAIHVRTYSKSVHEEGLHFVGWKYFKLAMDKFPADSQFVVFSDRMNWTKEKFRTKFPEKDFIFIEGNDHIEDLFLMSMMKNQILSKSTYSWWAAYLNKNESKLVCAPVKKNSGLPLWIKQPMQNFLNLFRKIPFWSNEDYYLPEWNIVYYELEPYPEDINDFGDITKSVSPMDK